jgi:hypothetical protein
MSGLDQAEVLARLASELGGAPTADDRARLEWLVADWAREADGAPDPAAVHRFQREDLDARLAGREGAARLDAFRAHVLARRVDRLGARTFALGRTILDGSVGDEEARSHGEALRRDADGLAAELGELAPDPSLEPTRRALADAAMEALFAIDRQAMSPRLAREQSGGAPRVF